jgi:arylformamidase
MSVAKMSRRRMLEAASVIGLSAVASAQQRLPVPGPPPHEHGPRVFLDYDQVELDAAYNQANYAFNGQQVEQRAEANSERIRKLMGEPMRVSYGSAEIEKMDIYRTKAANAPIRIFVHGGAWRNGQAKNSGYLAEPFVRAGAHFAIPDFAPVQNLGGNLIAMEAQIRRAIAWVYKNAKSFGGDANRIYLSGHFSGGHLAASALITDWQREYGISADTIKGGMIVSGLFELYPVSLSARREYVKFDEATLDGLSAQRHIDKLNMPLVVAHASLDTPEFQRQSREFAAALKAAGKRVEFLVGEGYNHFEFIETMANPYGILGAAALAQMGLANA